MNSLKKLVIILTIFLSGVLIGRYIIEIKVHKEMSIDCLNIMLYDLETELDLLEHWKLKYNNDQILEENIKFLILNKIIVLSDIKPDIQKLQGTPLKALHRLLIFNQRNELSTKKLEDVFKVYAEYLTSIEHDVYDEVNKQKETLKKGLQQMKKGLSTDSVPDP